MFHTEEDRAEVEDLAAKYPEKVKELVGLWFEEAAKYNVLPLIDYSIEKDLAKILALEYKLPVTPSGIYTFYPGTLSIPERSTPNVHGVSYKILAEVQVTSASQGVIFAQGSRFGGHTLFIRKGMLSYVYNFLGIPPEQKLSAKAPASGRHILGVQFTKERMGKYQESYGSLRLYVDDAVVAEEEIRTMTGHFSLCGEGLCIGYDSGDAVSGEYKPKFEFSGGTIARVVFEVADDAYIDVERHMAAAMARD